MIRPEAKAFIQASRAFTEAAERLSDAWKGLNADEFGATTLWYPFPKTFDQVAADVVEWQQRFEMNFLAYLASRERRGSLGWWYLSYVGGGFLGGAIVEGYGFLTACMRADELGLNPGGQVAGSQVSPEHLPDESFRNRKLTAEEIKAMWPGAMSIGEFNELTKNSSKVIQ